MRAAERRLAVYHCWWWRASTRHGSPAPCTRRRTGLRNSKGCALQRSLHRPARAAEAAVRARVRRRARDPAPRGELAACCRPMGGDQVDKRSLYEERADHHRRGQGRKPLAPCGRCCPTCVARWRPPSTRKPRCWGRGQPPHGTLRAPQIDHSPGGDGNRCRGAGGDATTARVHPTTARCATRLVDYRADQNGGQRTAGGSSDQWCGDHPGCAAHDTRHHRQYRRSMPPTISCRQGELFGDLRGTRYHAVGGR